MCVATGDSVNGLSTRRQAEIVSGGVDYLPLYGVKEACWGQQDYYN